VLSASRFRRDGPALHLRNGYHDALDLFQPRVQVREAGNTFDWLSQSLKTNLLGYGFVDVIGVVNLVGGCLCCLVFMSRDRAVKRAIEFLH
jgi:hypothetical protein